MKCGRILVTGASGNVGSGVFALLEQAGADVRAGSSNPERVRSGRENGEKSVHLDLLDPSTYSSALEGVDKIFFIRPPSISDVKKYIAPFIRCAADTKVKHIVFMSLQGVEKNSFVPHHAIEKCIVESEIPYTFLRPSFFMQNLSTTHREEIRDRSMIFVPAGKGKTSFIDARDISAVATKVLCEEGHQFKAYELTGKDSIGYDEAAEIFSEVLGRRIVYADPSPVKFYFDKRKRGFDRSFVLVMIALYSVARFGLASRTTKDTEGLLGREPISFARFVRDHKSVWQ
ncbi:MAG: SDR family oxidoreductase [Chitinispirillaceae bacterium]